MASRESKRRKLSPENDNEVHIPPDSLVEAQATGIATNGTHLGVDGQRVLAYDDASPEADSDSQDVESGDMMGDQREERGARRPADEPQATKIPPQLFGKTLRNTTDVKSSRVAGAKAAFGSNIFKFQSEELLKQIRPDYSSRKAPLDSTLRTLKTIIEQANKIGPLPVNLANTSLSILY